MVQVLLLKLSANHKNNTKCCAYKQRRSAAKKPDGVFVTGYGDFVSNWASSFIGKWLAAADFPLRFQPILKRNAYKEVPNVQVIKPGVGGH